MKLLILNTGLLLLIAFNSISQDVTFPRQLTNEGSVLTMYQPQVDEWKDYKDLEFRMAFSLKPTGGKEVIGVIYMKAATDVDVDSHRVFINNWSLVKTNFPSLDEENAREMGNLVSPFLSPTRSLEMSLEQVVACTPKKDSVSTITVNNEPPVIFVSKKPTILLQIDGAPVTANAGNENLEFIINANYPLFYDSTNKKYYLHDGLEWQTTMKLQGPWSFTNKLPNALATLANDSNWAALKETIPAVANPDKKLPGVFYSEQLAELILFEGEPAYKTIPSTKLKYATNTNSDIFFCSSDKKYYYVTSGRWFSSPGLSGPWTFATANLPADFLKIPNDSPAAAILPFVPGSEQAKDAVMIAQIPTTISVDATEAAKEVKISYSGEPEFKPVENTTLYYAVNTTEKVIRLNNNEYYACVNGIWFVSSLPEGPWQTAVSVPQVIYNMPASSPVYNVTYVTQTVSPTNIVHASYTAGYMGVYMVAAPLGVIVISGTGFYYPPYYYYPPYGYPIYYPYPVTYGMYAFHHYHYGHVAYHASYNPHTGMHTRSVTAYNHYGSATAARGYNASTGTYARGASVSTPYGHRSAAQAYNPYTGTRAATRQGSSPYGQWGTSAVSRNGQTVRTGHVTTAGGTTAGIKTAGGDMYATRNGNVYKNTGNGWQEANRPQPTQHTTANTSARPQASTTRTQPSTQDLNRDYQNRSRGNAQTRQYSSGRSNAGSSMQRGGGSTRRR